jgi:hypothetical protein
VIEINHGAISQARRFVDEPFRLDSLEESKCLAKAAKHSVGQASSLSQPTEKQYWINLSVFRADQMLRYGMFVRQAGSLSYLASPDLFKRLRMKFPRR